MLLLLISFVAGFLTILAPCVLPLLPIIVGGSVSGSTKQKSRPYIIAASLAGSIILFTLLLKVSTYLINLSPNVLLLASGTLIIGLGLVSVFPELWEKLMIRLNLQATTQRLLGEGEQSPGKYSGPILIGMALGPVFSSCSPTYAFILASILPRNFVGGLIYLITYSFALVIALLLVSLLGRKFITKMNWAVNTHSLFRRMLGIIFVIVGIAIISGQEIKIETWVANHLPFDETRIEQLLLSKQHNSIATFLSSRNRSNVLNVQSTRAPALVGLSNWINSGPLQISGLKSKVVLIDFWTYSCVNCNRALPYVEKWYQAYHSKGLVVIGVHTPEFAFEHNPVNVAKAVKADNITYPVALDNNYDTWNAYQNDSWPADYLIDKSGNIRYVSLGEGNYNITEEAIQYLLGINSTLRTPVSVVPISPNQTPETYFGTNRQTNYIGSPLANSGTYNFTSVPEPQLNQNLWTLGGVWQINSENITSQSSNSTLTFSALGKDVYVVAGNISTVPTTIKVELSSNASGQYSSEDPNGNLVINGPGLYHIVSLHKFSNPVIKLIVPAGVSLYTFTFGS